MESGGTRLTNSGAYTVEVSEPAPTLPRITRGGESNKLTIGSPSCGSSASTVLRSFAKKLKNDGRIYAKVDATGNVTAHLDYPAYGGNRFIKVKLFFVKDEMRSSLRSSGWLSISRSGGSLSLRPALSDYSDRQYDLVAALRFRDQSSTQKSCVTKNNGYIEIR